MTTLAPAFLEPSPYRRIDNFLGEELVKRLLTYAEARQSDFSQSGVGSSKETSIINKEIRQSLMLWDFGDLQSVLQERFEALLPWAVSELHLSPITLGRLELQLVAHGDGSFFREHLDTHMSQPDAKTDRVLTAVYYFFRRPRRFTGGELRLFAFAPDTDGTRRFIDIAPDHDMLLLFPSWAPHEVRPVSCPSGEFMDSRFAVNCWFRQPRKG